MACRGLFQYLRGMGGTPSADDWDRSPSIIREALSLAELGLRVLPVRELSKLPRLKSWQKLATCDSSVIQNWPVAWTRRGNLGLATGRGVLALDVDPRSGGAESLDRLTTQHGSLPVTAEAATGGGGRHLLFRVDADLVVRNSHPQERGVAVAGIHVRGDGGQILVEPSIHPNGREYVWLVHPRQGIADAPAWLLGMLVVERRRKPRQRQRQRPARQRTRRVKRAGPVPTSPPPPLELALDVPVELVRDLCERFEITATGQRHNLMVRAVGRMVAQAHDDAVITGVLLAWWEFFHGLGLTTTDRPEHERELLVCLRSTRQNAKFAATAKSPAWHRERCREIKLTGSQTRMIKSAEIADENGPKKSPLAPLRQGHCKEVTQMHSRLCKSDDEFRFIEAILVHVMHERINMHHEGDIILMTDDQLRQIAADRRGGEWRPWNNQQMDRLKSKFVTRPGRQATRFELLEMIRRGRASHAGRRGTPSVYRPTGVELFLAPQEGNEEGVR